MKTVEAVRASFWFVPSVLALIAVLLSLFTIAADQGGTRAWLDRLGFIYLNQPGGARSLLSTIAGSMMNVAGVVFSLTIVALTLASQQFGPRLLGNFMRDRGNQTVLGIFVATFLYCLLVLRTVRSASDESQAFVPHLSVTVALLLALITLGATIYFINHIAQSIQVHNVMHKVARSLHRQIGENGKSPIFPANLGKPYGGEARLPEGFEQGAKAIAARRSGYFQSVDSRALIRLARESDVVIQLQHRPGEYIFHGQAVALVYPGNRVETLDAQLRDYLALGSERTAGQDLSFLFDQLLELALRSLSSANSDPITATGAVDRIVDGLLQLGERRLPANYRADDQGELRVVVPPLSVPELARRLFSLLRSPVAAQLLAAAQTLRALETLQECTSNPELAAVAKGQWTELRARCKECMSPSEYRSLLELIGEVEPDEDVPD